MLSFSVLSVLCLLVAECEWTRDVMQEMSERVAEYERSFMNKL